ncbi:hypothetical protein HPB51_003254 [Rhipicephalus microplus]|uniref:Gpi-anchor transamidase n=1 Tax=Rhipicephalus microplus TaxID=6941 RepID=A0A9J6EEW9_RHIMP|nr:hypothetical protein HPB51_003254 [Rhipicephalus microplus]
MSPWKLVWCLFYLAVLTSLAALSCQAQNADESVDAKISEFFRSGHTNNWAVLVCTSRFWFNYRHVANVLSIYRSVKRFGIPDSQIILMIADDMPCNLRNPKPATVFNNAHHHINVYGDNVEVDYRGYEKRHKLRSIGVFFYLLIDFARHGGDGFLKFQDSEEVTNVELADAFEQMWQKRRYHEIFFMIDTCQAESMFKRFYSPNILAVASSKIGEDSLSHHGDPTIGVYVIDRYTYYALMFLEEVNTNNTKTMAQFLRVCPKSVCISTAVSRKDLFTRNLDQVPLTDFFGSVRNVELTQQKVSLKPLPPSNSFLKEEQLRQESESEARGEALDVEMRHEALKPEIATEKGLGILESIKLKHAESEALASLEVEAVSKDGPFED